MSKVNWSPNSARMVLGEPVSLTSVILDSVNRYDRALSEPIFRILIVGLGLVGAMYGLWWLATRLGRVFGIGKPIQMQALADRRFEGDMDKAQSAVRSTVPGAFLVLGISAYLFVHGVMGSGSETLQNLLLIGLLVWVGFFGLWRLLERDFAWPGVLVPRDAKGTSGMREVRRSRSEGGKAHR